MTGETGEAMRAGSASHLFSFNPPVSHRRSFPFFLFRDSGCKPRRGFRVITFSPSCGRRTFPSPPPKKIAHSGSQGLRQAV
jgi:hypothetical protein